MSTLIKGLHLNELSVTEKTYTTPTKILQDK